MSAARKKWRSGTKVHVCKQPGCAAKAGFTAAPGSKYCEAHGWRVCATEGCERRFVPRNVQRHCDEHKEKKPPSKLARDRAVRAARKAAAELEMQGNVVTRRFGRRCAECRGPMSSYNPDVICFACQEARKQEILAAAARGVAA